MEPMVDCAKCTAAGATIRKMAVMYQTSYDVKIGESVHRRVGVTYDLECTRCGHLFSLTVVDAKDDSQ